MKVAAHHLQALLATKHSKDLYVSECKDGPTTITGRRHVRLDGWAMNRSWRNLCFTGYEIKVGRSDFLGDDKWRAYLPLCHRLYFVAPPKLIGLNELPEHVGLLECTSGAERLLTRRKAVHRNVDPPFDLLVYVLMCRTQIGREQWDTREHRAAYWKNWLEQKGEYAQLGRQVSCKIRDITNRIECENQTLLARIKGYEALRERISELGWDPDAPISTWSLDRRLQAAVTGLPADLEREVRAAAAALDQIAKVLEQAKPGPRLANNPRQEKP